MGYRTLRFLAAPFLGTVFFASQPASAEVSALMRATLIPGPSGALRNGQTVTYTITYTNPPIDTISTGNVPPVLVSASFFPGPSLPNAVGFQIVDPLGQVTPSQQASLGGTPDTVGLQDASHVRNAYLAPQFPNQSPVLGTYAVSVYNQSRGPVSYSLASTVLPINRTPIQPGENLTPAAARPAAAATPASLGVLNRVSLTRSGSLGPGSTARYTIDFQPRVEPEGKLAPWLLSMNFSPSDPTTVPSVSFDLTDRTNPSIAGASFGNVIHAAPATPDLTPDAVGAADVSNLKNAVVWAAAPGTIEVAVLNYSGSNISYTLTLYPLYGDRFE